MTYSYDPSDLAGDTISHARFALGDILTDGGASTCFLCDEEIASALETSKSFKKALYTLADAVCMRLSYETDWHDDGTSFSLNQRAERWMKLRDKLKHDADAETMMPESGAVKAAARSADGGHYFYAGMHDSPYVQPPYPYRGEKK